MLEASRRELLEAVAGLRESEAATQPEPGKWSVLECVEHIVVVEGRFQAFLETAKPIEDPHQDPSKEAELAARIADRRNKANAPEAVHPSGRFSTLADALAAFEDARTKTISIARERGPELYGLGVTHGRFGPMNGAELMVVISGHSSRHADQIGEIRAAMAPV